jgi:hypothetical protein
VGFCGESHLTQDLELITSIFRGSVVAAGNWLGWLHLHSGDVDRMTSSAPS